MGGSRLGQESRLDDGRKRLVVAHLPLASEIAARLHRRHGLQVPLEDLEAYARAGLVDAARRFDPARGIAFPLFAHYRITGAIWDGVRRMGWRIRQRSDARFAEYANDYLEGLAGERPQGEEGLARSLEGRTGALAVIFVAVQDGMQEDVLDENEQGALRRLERAQLSQGLARSLKRLPARERLLFQGLYRDGRSLRDVAADLGVSQAWASRLHRKTIEELRTRLAAEGLLS